jgi:type VI secretion system secreted protein VgrG
VPWRQPMTTHRPRMEGLHTAIVLAPAGDEIYTDEQGRIKIRFFWDWRADATADNSDWVRVVQPWAGNGWGGQFIPRINTEVAVAFMDGDPDRPVVVGGFYNATDKPIFPVAEKTKTGFRTRSVLKGGTDAFNEFSLNDDIGKEIILLHAQKDLTTEVENDQILIVDNDRTVTVKGKETVTIKGDRAHEVTVGNESLVIKQGNQSIEVDTGNQTTLIKTGNQSTTLKTGNQTIELSMGNQTTTLDMGNQSTDAKLGNITIKADVGAITLQALQSITLKVGTNSLTISPTGVEIKGMMVSIEGQMQTEVKGLMTTTSGTAMLTLKGAITMIN